MINELKAGQMLYAGCSDHYYGPIDRVGKDAGGFDVVDLWIDDINDFMTCERFGDSNPLTFVSNHAPILFRDVQYRRDDTGEFPDLVYLNMPGDGCGGCTYRFWIREKEKE